MTLALGSFAHLCKGPASFCFLFQEAITVASESYLPYTKSKAV